MLTGFINILTILIAMSDKRTEMYERHSETLETLRSVLLVLHGDSCRLPLATYRVMIALGEAGEPCSAYAVARRAGFLLEHGRVKLHEAKRYGVVCNAHVIGQGVLWDLTERGRVELERVKAQLDRVMEQRKLMPSAQDAMPKRRWRRKRGE